MHDLLPILVYKTLVLRIASSLWADIDLDGTIPEDQDSPRGLQLCQCHSESTTLANIFCVFIFILCPVIGPVVR